MNIRLVCTANSKLCKGSFIVYKGGKAEIKETFAIANKGDESKLKEYVFESVIRGLRNVRSLVNHDDLLLIELPNMHMVEWLNGSKEYKGYNQYLDTVADIVDTLDCRYLFTKTNVKDAKKLLEESVSKVEVMGIDDAFEGM